MSVPWIVFLAGCAWMIWKGTQAKKEYIRRKAKEEEEKAKAVALEDRLADELRLHENTETELSGIAGAMRGRGQRMRSQVN